MIKREKERFSLRLFVAALAIVVVVFGLFALPYAVLETYGLKAKKLILLVTWSFLAIFSGSLLIFWIARYRQTGKEIEMLHEEIERELNGRKESEQDTPEGRVRYGHKRKHR